MPAPTALQKKPEEVAEAQMAAQPQEEDEEVLLDASSALPTAQAASTVPEPTHDDTEMTVDAEGGTITELMKHSCQRF